MLHPSYQSVLAEFSRLLSTYIVFSGRASFNWAVDCPGLVFFLTGPAHDDNGAQRSSSCLLASGPPALVIFCLTTSAGSFFTESNTQPSSIFLLKRMSYIRFLISTYTFTSSYTRIIILKTHKIPFSYLHPYFVVFPTQRWFFTTGFPLNQLNCPTSYFLTKTKWFFWQINKFLKKIIISGLQKFGLHQNMQNKVELFDRGPGQKMGCNKLLKN